MKDGDQNTKYFHNVIKMKQYRNRVLRIKDMDGSICSDQNSIQAAFERYYKTLFTGEQRHWNVTTAEILMGKKLSVEQQKGSLPFRLLEDD
ncbi:hypothetical protein RIF29_15232 [Crotalaria pallida]|uniref:Uncharacterized protein n=1 Tax=Crotalaria pallida TaxID=3830 RepID=A0AAN9FIL9_CROPI